MAGPGQPGPPKTDRRCQRRLGDRQGWRPWRGRHPERSPPSCRRPIARLSWTVRAHTARRPARP
eukprot:8139702-Alexandrium_andersonii.AAC.1